MNLKRNTFKKDDEQEKTKKTKYTRIKECAKGKIKMLGCLNLSMPNSKIINEWKSHKTKWKIINGIRKTIQMIEIL